MKEKVFARSRLVEEASHRHASARHVGKATTVNDLELDRVEVVCLGVRKRSVSHLVYELPPCNPH